MINSTILQLFTDEVLQDVATAIQAEQDRRYRARAADEAEQDRLYRAVELAQAEQDRLYEVARQAQRAEPSLPNFEDFAKATRLASTYDPPESTPPQDDPANVHQPGESEPDIERDRR